MALTEALRSFVSGGSPRKYATKLSYWRPVVSRMYGA